MLLFVGNEVQVCTPFGYRPVTGGRGQRKGIVKKREGARQSMYNSA